MDPSLRDKVNSYLWYAYVPTYRPEILSGIVDDVEEFRSLKSWLETASSTQVLREGRLVLRKAFDNCLAQSDCDLHLVPLSGGIDSRAILAHLVESGLREQIVTCTFGVPGAYDYDFAAEVAKVAGVKHEVINLNDVSVERSDLVAAAADGGAWTDLFNSFYNQLARRHLECDALHWTGFLGEVLAGDHYRYGYEDLSFPQALEVFSQTNRQVGSGGRSYHRDDYSPIEVLPDSVPLSDPFLISFPEQLDLTIRQAGWLSGVVSTKTSAVPFRDRGWMRFILAAPAGQRRRSKLFREILLEQFPELFRLRTKSVAGFRLHRPMFAALNRQARALNARLSFFRGVDAFDPYQNYIDYRQAFRGRSDFQSLVRESIERIQSMHLIDWIDLEEVLRSHASGRENLSDILSAIVSIEVSASHDLEARKSP